MKPECLTKRQEGSYLEPSNSLKYSHTHTRTMSVLHWNMNGFQEYKLSSLMSSFPHFDILVLTETKETDKMQSEDVLGHTVFDLQAFVNPQKKPPRSTASGGIKFVCKQNIANHQGPTISRSSIPTAELC